MAWDDRLVGVGREIAGSSAEIQRVLAGPGTGKSFALQRKVARLLEIEHALPARILVVTFTRVAAADLKRNMSRIGTLGSDEIDARTLHSYCFRLLSKTGVLPLLNRVPRAMIAVQNRGWLQYEYDPLLCDLGNKYGRKKDRIERLRSYEAAWARLQHDDPGAPTEELDVAFATEVRSWLVFHQAILIGELVPLALMFLRENPAREELRQYDHIVVDEYQDLNRAEQVLIEILARHATLTVVGDEDQSIYSFKWANPDGILSFAEDHPQLEDRSLSECRRCPTSVVDAANALIAHNHRSGGGRPLKHFSGNSFGKIYNIQWSTLNDEVRGLAQYVESLIASGIDAGTILILCPSRIIGYGIRDALIASAVPAHSFYHEEALEPDEAKLAFALFRLAIYPEDRVSLRFWLGYGGTEFRQPSYAQLRQVCEDEGVSPYSILYAMHTGVRSRTGFAPLLRRFATLIERLAEMKDKTVSEQIEMLFPPDVQWSSAFREIIDTLDIDQFSVLTDIYQKLSDYITQPDVPEDPDFVRIMSLYKSKGLTAHTVILCGAVDGAIPRYDEDLAPPQARDYHEEQRRLFYVGITRSADTLVLSSSISIPQPEIYSVGARRDATGLILPSPFIAECGRTIPYPIEGRDWLSNLGI